MNLSTSKESINKISKRCLRCYSEQQWYGENFLFDYSQYKDVKNNLGEFKFILLLIFLGLYSFSQTDVKINLFTAPFLIPNFAFEIPTSKNQSIQLDVLASFWNEFSLFNDEHFLVNQTFNSGVYSIMVPLHSIPNMIVKRYCGDNTWGVAPWENSTMPKFFI